MKSALYLIAAILALALTQYAKTEVAAYIACIFFLICCSATIICWLIDAEN